MQREKLVAVMDSQEDFIALNNYLETSDILVSVSGVGAWMLRAMRRGLMD